MDFQHKKQGCVAILLTGLLFVVLCGCSITPQIRHHTPRQIEQPIIAPFQSYRVVQVCLDTPPLFPARFFREAAMAIADGVDASVTVNQLGFAVYVTLITHNSFQDDVLQFAVPAFPADPASPPSPKLGDDPYANAQSQSVYQKAFAAWQEALMSQHHKLALLRIQVKKWTDTLRSLTPPYDPIADDLYGCLVTASQHFQNVNGNKYLVIASPLANNTLVNATSSINLAGVRVNVLYRTCRIASVCLANDAKWKHILQGFGAKAITILDPAQSDMEKPTF